MSYYLCIVYGHGVKIKTKGCVLKTSVSSETAMQQKQFSGDIALIFVGIDSEHNHTVGFIEFFYFGLDA